jgi:hypothetical protein
MGIVLWWVKPHAPLLSGAATLGYCDRGRLPSNWCTEDTYRPSMSEVLSLEMGHFALRARLGTSNIAWIFRICEVLRHGHGD